MAKAKVTKSSMSGPQKAMHSRVSYLYQAAAYVAANQEHSIRDKTDKPTDLLDGQRNMEPTEENGKLLSRRFVSELRSIALKAQLRISPDMKQSICKNCDTLLVDGSTCINAIENKSKGGKKSWADVLLRKCTTCEKETRTPLAPQRQKRRPFRSPEESLKVVLK